MRFCPRGKGPAYCVVSTPGHDVIGSAGAPAQVLGMVEPPPSAPTCTPPVHYGYNSGNTYTTNAYGCGPGGYARYPCARGASGNGWDNGGGKSSGVIYGGGNEGKHPWVTNGYPPRMAGHPGFPFRRARSFGMGGFSSPYN